MLAPDTWATSLGTRCPAVRSPVPSSDPAVFLSHASPDAEAARRIADALRGFGVEVWLDLNEPRGSDSCDATLRSQIETCALFVPLISRATQQQTEARFRLEWQWADDRTRLLPPARPFIVPVVIDDTAEYGASVPPSFARTPWSRLPGGQPSMAFLDQIKHLIQTIPAPASAAPTVPAPSAARPVEKRRRFAWVFGAALAVTGAVAAIAFRNVGPMFRSPPAPPADTAAHRGTATVSAPAVDRRNIAVLPFANLSADAAASSFFADGFQEDLLTTLSYLGELRVVSRTSARQYRTTQKSAHQIGRELHVGTLLEGSVLRSGDHVRVTSQLTDATTGQHLWAQAYDRELQDIFAIQRELAQAVAQTLGVDLTEKEAATLALIPTHNSAAYELFLREREHHDDSTNTSERMQQSIELLQRAVALDPTFAQAWSLLAVNHAEFYFRGYDQTPHRLELATMAIDHALSLAPHDPTVQADAGRYHDYGFRDYVRAAAYFQQVLEVAPHNVDALASMGFIRRREGRWAESVTLMEQALALDPRNLTVLRALAVTYELMRHYDLALARRQTLHELVPDDLAAAFEVARLQSIQSESAKPVELALVPYAGIITDAPEPVWQARFAVARSHGDWTQCLDLLDHPPAGANAARLRSQRLKTLWAADRLEEARLLAQQTVDDLQRTLEATPHDLELLQQRFLALCLLGARDESQVELNHLTQLQLELRDAIDGQFWRTMRIDWFAFFGTPDQTAAAIRAALRYPGCALTRWSFLQPDFPATVSHSAPFQDLMTDASAWAPLPLD